MLIWLVGNQEWTMPFKEIFQNVWALLFLVALLSTSISFSSLVIEIVTVPLLYIVPQLSSPACATVSWCNFGFLKQPSRWCFLLFTVSPKWEREVCVSGMKKIRLPFETNSLPGLRCQTLSTPHCQLHIWCFKMVSSSNGCHRAIKDPWPMQHFSTIWLKLGSQLLILMLNTWTVLITNRTCWVSKKCA